MGLAKRVKKKEKVFTNKIESKTFLKVLLR